MPDFRDSFTTREVYEAMLNEITVIGSDGQTEPELKSRGPTRLRMLMHKFVSHVHPRQNKVMLKNIPACQFWPIFRFKTVNNS